MSAFSSLSRWPLALPVALALGVGAPLIGQPQEAEVVAPAAEGAEGEAGAEGGPAVRAGVDIDALLAEDEAVFAEDGYAYDAAGRRDPFLSLLVARESAEEVSDARLEGVPGLLVSEVDLTGIFILPDGPVAQVQSASLDKSYLLRVGDRLYDGSVVGITSNEVVFRQIVDDPTALKPFREVVKKLNPELE